MKLRSSRVLRRVTPRVDPQYHIGVSDPHDLDRPHYTLSGLHTTPGDKILEREPHSVVEPRVLKRILNRTNGYR